MRPVDRPDVETTGIAEAPLAEGARVGPWLRGFDRLGRSLRVAPKIEPTPGVSPWLRSPPMAPTPFPPMVASRKFSLALPTPIGPY